MTTKFCFGKQLHLLMQKGNRNHIPQPVQHTKSDEEVKVRN